MQSLDLAAEDRAELEAKVLAAAFKQSFESGDSDGAGLAHTHLCAILQAREAASKANEFGQTERSKEISATIDRMHRTAVTRAECVLVIFRPSDKPQPAPEREAVPDFAVPEEINLEVKNESELATEAYSTASLKPQAKTLRAASDDPNGAPFSANMDRVFDEGATSEFSSYFELDEPLTLGPAADAARDWTIKSELSRILGEDTKSSAQSKGDIDFKSSPQAAPEEEDDEEEPVEEQRSSGTAWRPPDFLEKKPEPKKKEAEKEPEPKNEPPEPVEAEDPQPGKTVPPPELDPDLQLPKSEPGAGPLSYLDFGDTEDDTKPEPAAVEQPAPPVISKVEIKVPVTKTTGPSSPSITASGATGVPEIAVPPQLAPVGEGAVEPGSFYDALGVGDTSTYEEIHTCFLRRLRGHIRTHQARAPESVSRGEIKAFKEHLRYLCIAHDILKDPVTRTDYDLRRLGLRQLEGPEGGGRLNGGKRTALKIGELLECANIIQPTELQVALDMHKAEPNMPFGQFLLSAGFLSEEELDSAILGQKLITFGKVTVAQFQTAINLQRKEKVPFFDTLVSEGWLTPADIFDESSELFGGPGFGDKDKETAPPPEPEAVPQIVIPEVKPVAQSQSTELDPAAFNLMMSWEEEGESQSEETSTADSTAQDDTTFDTATAGDTSSEESQSGEDGETRGNGKTDNPARQSKQGMKKHP
jgi:hypothetical protein